jgi:lysophospholipase L1-like esterase
MQPDWAKFAAAAILLLLAGCASAGKHHSFTPPADGARPTLYVIGDSTAAAYPQERYPLFGWAQVLPYYFDTGRIAIQDRAISGRSSKSFWDEGAWTPIREALQPGDFVFIQFGHNDEKSEDPRRYTDPATTYREFLARYIDDARAAGANPILLTPIHRNGWTTPNHLKDSHGAYPDAVRALARERAVPLIDLHARTGRLFERLGQDRTTQLFINLPAGLYPNYPEGKPDNTHLKETGAYAISALAIDGIVQQSLPLRDYLKPAFLRPSWARQAVRW